MAGFHPPRPGWSCPPADITAAFGGTGLRTAYGWDAENRLVRVGPMAGYEIAGDVQVTFAYDYLSRRVAKRVYTYDPNASPAWVLTKDRRFIWDGWLMLREIDQDSVPVQTYLWGLDLAGQMGSVGVSPASGGGGVAFLTQAGGIGGLIAVNIAQPEPNTPSGTFIYCYDGNGNVTQLVRPINGTLSAKYDYDPYGTRVNAPAAGEAVQPWRFSTKQLDAETGLQYFGYRYRAERWISRDPIEEEGGIHIYVYVRNDPVRSVDPLGLLPEDSMGPPVYPPERFPPKKNKRDCCKLCCEDCLIVVVRGAEDVGALELADAVGDEEGCSTRVVDRVSELRSIIEDGKYCRIMVISHGSDIGETKKIKRRKTWYPQRGEYTDDDPMLSGGSGDFVVTPADVGRWSKAACLKSIELYSCFQGFRRRAKQWKDAFGDPIEVITYPGVCRPRLRALLE